MTAIDDQFEPIKRDILKCDPIPSVKAVYATKKQEVVGLHILKVASSEIDSSSGIRVVLVARTSGDQSNKEASDKQGQSFGKNKFRSEPHQNRGI